MTDDDKALELVNEACRELDFDTYDLNNAKVTYGRCFTALCRAIEQHEAFRQEVSNAVEEIAKAWGTADPAWGYLRRFIIAKPDPLVEALHDMDPDCRADAESLRAALAKRGLEIREKE